MDFGKTLLIEEAPTKISFIKNGLELFSKLIKQDKANISERTFKMNESVRFINREDELKCLNRNAQIERLRISIEQIRQRKVSSLNWYGIPGIGKITLNSMIEKEIHKKGLFGSIIGFDLSGKLKGLLEIESCLGSVIDWFIKKKKKQNRVFQSIKKNIKSKYDDIKNKAYLRGNDLRFPKVKLCY